MSVKTLNHIYEQVSVYHALIITESYSEHVPLLHDLEKNDFPAIILREDDFSYSILKELEENYRVFILNQGDMETYMQAKCNVLTDITVMMCTTQAVCDKMHLFLSQKQHCLKDSLYLFSSEQ
jgi:hypothetical protein